MASYTANQLNGAGTPIEALNSGSSYVFEITSSTCTGSAYFTVETVRDSNGFYDSTRPTNALGLYSDFVNLNQNTLITSSYISSVVVPGGESSYKFTPSSDIAISSSFLRGTGGITLNIDGGSVVSLLLDTYPNASAAYSLRDLASASVGSAVVRVRRSSDNTEQDFTSAEITDGTLTTFTGANDGFVTTWYDQSGNSNNAIQATAILQPKLVTSGVVGQVNNKPALTLFANGVGLSTSTSYAGSDFSVVSVYDKNLSTGVDTIFLDNNLNSPDGIFSYRNGSKQGVYRSGDKTIEGNLKDGQAIAFTLLSNNVISYYNNTDLVGSSTDANAAANVDFNSFRIGRANLFEIQEVILYPTNQTSNIQGFNDNINNHYSVYEIPISGLLFDYPDALVAYSLRQLTTFESGNKVNVVRVRRSSDNVEQDFIDTEITDGTLATFTGANDGFVVKWYDQSGNLNNAVQTAATNQPKLVDNGTVILDNGKPAIKYDSTGFDTFTTLNNVTGINSIFYVLNAETSTGGPTQSLLGDNFGNLDYVSGQSGDILLWTGVPNDIKNGSNYIDSQPYNFLATDRPLVQSLITMIHNSPIGAFNQISEDRGIGRSWEGKLQELVVYPSDQTTNRNGIETNINTEYTIY